MDPQSQEKYATIYNWLNDLYGRPEWRPHEPPVNELVLTILSQSTADINTRRAYDALVSRYPTWEQMIDAPTGDIIAAIRPAGMANMKGPRIQNALRHIYREQGELTLDFLADMPLDEAMDWLTGIEGIGPKTASIILLFSFGRPVFPVDVHVHRVSGRLGLFPPKTSFEKAHEIMIQLGPPATYYPMHMNLIRHGRQICRSRNPQCAICPLANECNYFRLNIGTISES